MVLGEIQRCSQERVRYAGLGQVLQHDIAAEHGDELYTDRELCGKSWAGLAGLQSVG